MMGSLIVEKALVEAGVKVITNNTVVEVMGGDRVRGAALDDGEVIRLGKRDLTIYYAPGHAPHHIAIQDSLTGGIFCGDALGYISEDMADLPMPVGLPPFDPEAYLKTIDRLAGLSPRIVYYAHHGARSDADELIRLVREMTVGFCDVVRGSLEAGEDDERISERILEYVRTFEPDAELHVIVQASIAGYIAYYRNQM